MSSPTITPNDPVFDTIAKYVGLRIIQSSNMLDTDPNICSPQVYEFKGKRYLRYRKYYGNDASTQYGICIDTMTVTSKSRIKTPLQREHEIMLEDWFEFYFEDEVEEFQRNQAKMKETFRTYGDPTTTISLEVHQRSLERDYTWASS